MTRPISVALAQVAVPTSETTAQRIGRVLGQLAQIDGADLVVLPELWTVGFSNFDAYRDAAEPLDGPTVTTFKRLAQDKGWYFAPGSIVEAADDGSLRNTSVLITPEGEIAHSYSKTHLFGSGRGESAVLSPGGRVTAADTALGRYSGAICYDLRFPGLWQQIGLRAPDLVTVVAAWPARRIEHWRALTTARAIEQQAFVLACAVADHPDGPNYTGHSRVVSPRGEVIAEAGPGPEVLRATIDLDEVAAFRAVLPAIYERDRDYA